MRKIFGYIDLGFIGIFFLLTLAFGYDFFIKQRNDSASETMISGLLMFALSYMFFSFLFHLIPMWKRKDLWSFFRVAQFILAMAAGIVMDKNGPMSTFYILTLLSEIFYIYITWNWMKK